MNKLKEIPKAFVLVLFLVTVSISVTLLYFVYNKMTNPKSTSETIERLVDSQVTEYEGKDLSSIEDFRENSIKGPQYVDEDTYRLKVLGLVDEELNLTYREALDSKKYEKIVTLYCVEGWDATILWEGILLRDLFEKAGVDESAKTVIFRAYDGYSTSLALDYVLENDILLAYKMNGVELPPERGFPFQVVAESKWGYKWAKWITEIELSSDENFKGYWEEAGYNLDGDVEGPKFEGN